jgi:hypothetical protein
MGAAALALLGRVWPYLAGIALILGGVWYIYDKGADNARKEAEARQAKIEKKLDDQKRDLEKALADRVQQIADQLGVKLSGIDQVNRTEVQPIIVREIANGPARLRDPGAGLTPGMFGAIERARQLSDAPPAGQQNRRPMPSPTPAR